MQRPLLLSILSLSLILTACRGKLAGTATLTGNGEAEARFQSTGGKLTLWADTDGKWEGGENSHMDVRYDIEILQQGKTIGRLTCNTADVSTSVCGTHIDMGGSHSADCELKLPCPVPNVPAGETVFRVKATTGPNVKSTKKVSLNIRAGS